MGDAMAASSQQCDWRHYTLGGNNYLIKEAVEGSDTEVVAMMVVLGRYISTVSIVRYYAIQGS